MWQQLQFAGTKKKKTKKIEEKKKRRKKSSSVMSSGQGSWKAISDVKRGRVPLKAATQDRAATPDKATA